MSRTYTAAQIRREQLVRLARRDLATFAKLMWPILNPGVQLVWGWHMDAICMHLEAVSSGEIQRLVINVPPGTGKTTLVSVIWPAWEWLHHPETRWIGASYDLALSTRMNQDRRTLVRSQVYQDLRPGFGLQLGQRRTTLFANDRRGWMRSTSTGAGITGEHADIGLIDDPIRPDQVWGPELKGHVEWFGSVFASRFRDPSKSRVVVVMQRVHEADLTGHLLSGESAMGAFEHLLLPMEYDPARAKPTCIGWRDPRKVEGELLMPERFPANVLDSKKRDRTTWATQYQQHPVAGDGNIFDAKWWKWWRRAPAVEEFAGFVDCNYGTGDDPDFFVAQVWGRVGRGLYLLDQLRGRFQFVPACNALWTFMDRHPKCLRWFVEEKSNGSAIISAARDVGRRMKGINPTDTKASRGASVAPLVAGGHVYLPSIEPLAEQPGYIPDPWRPDIWMPGFTSEAASFPRGANDDQVDAMTMALDFFRQRIGERGASAPAPGGGGVVEQRGTRGGTVKGTWQDRRR